MFWWQKNLAARASSENRVNDLFCVCNGGRSLPVAAAIPGLAQFPVRPPAEVKFHWQQQLSETRRPTYFSRKLLRRNSPKQIKNAARKHRDRKYKNGGNRGIVRRNQKGLNCLAGGRSLRHLPGLICGYVPGCTAAGYASELAGQKRNKRSGS